MKQRRTTDPREFEMFIVANTDERVSADNEPALQKVIHGSVCHPTRVVSCSVLRLVNNRDFSRWFTENLSEDDTVAKKAAKKAAPKKAAKKAAPKKAAKKKKK